MTAVAALRLPRPLPHQHAVLSDPSRRKVWRAGRRTGKSVAGRVAGIRGHGPKGPDGRRTLRGMLDGANIAWLTKTYKQSKVVWRKLMKAFRSIEGSVVRIDRETRRIEMLGNAGALTVWSGHTRDAIDNLRGDGYDGFLLDEAAYIDAEYAINDVVEPALLDTGGWVFVFSSPNAGWDGNEARLTPSFFNRLCHNIDIGEERLWRQWHNATEDNPRIDRENLRLLRERYGADSPTAQQELDALLVAGGLLAFVVQRARLEVAAFKVPEHWTYFAAFDWGYNHPFSLGLFTVSEDGVVYLVDRLTSRRKAPSEIVEAARAFLEKHGLTFKQLRYTVAGHDCWQDHKARGERTPTIAEQCAQRGWVLQRANIARIAGANNLRQYLTDDRFKAVTSVLTSRGEMPTQAMAVVGCLETRINDPDNPEDVLKQDADQDGRGGDDDYDMLRYGLASRPLRAKAPLSTVRRPADKSAPLAELTKRTTPEAATKRPPVRATPDKGRLVFRPGLVMR